MDTQGKCTHFLIRSYNNKLLNYQRGYVMSALVGMQSLHIK